MASLPEFKMWDVPPRRRNELQAMAQCGISADKSGLGLKGEEIELYEYLLQERAYWTEKYPDVPFIFEPVELDTDIADFE